MTMIDKALMDKEMVIFAHLRQNSRIPLTDLSKKTNIPVSTLFDTLQEKQRQKIIIKHATLFDFQKIGFGARATVLLGVEKDDREKLGDYLMKSVNVNTVYRINNGYDFIMECVFKNIRELEFFTELLESKFRIKSKEVHYVIDDLKREGFMADPELTRLLVGDQK